MSNYTSETMKQCFAEFIGLALVIFFGAGCLCALILAGAQLGLWEICITWGLGFALAIYLTAGVSGAHLNPAVTIALWLFGNFDRKKVMPYIVAQIAGAFAGAMITYMLYAGLFDAYETANGIIRGSVESLQLAAIFTTYPHPDITVLSASLVEFVITAILMLLIMALTDDGNGVPRGVMAPLLIGVLVAVIGAASAPLTGFAMNPARDFGPKIFVYLFGWGDIAFTGARSIPYFIVPIVAPIVGACAGAKLYLSFVKPNNEVVSEPVVNIDIDEEIAIETAQ